MAGLVSAYHAGAAGARVPGGHPRQRHQQRQQRPGTGGRGGLTSGLGLLPLTVPEVRRLLVALVWAAPVEPGSCWAGPGGTDVTRSAPDGHTIDDANRNTGGGEVKSQVSMLARLPGCAFGLTRRGSKPQRDPGGLHRLVDHRQ